MHLPRRLRPFRLAFELRRATCACAAITIATTPALAPAQSAKGAKPSKDPTPADKAAQLKAEGDAAFDAFLYADALRSYEAAYEISKDPALLYNQGRALQALNRHPEALTMLERFDAEAPPALKAKVPGLGKLIADVRSRVAVLRVTCNVEGAQIVVGDRVVGETGGLGEIRLNAGTVTVKVQREGYFPVRREVQLPGGGAVTIDVRLLPRATSGVLAIDAVPKAAHVSIDGKPVGDAPVELVLPQGTHDISLTSPGYEPLSSKAVVKADGRVDVKLTMRETPSITSQWWFWTGIGVIVVSGVAIGVALTTERSAPKGDFSPGQVSAPLWSF